VHSQAEYANPEGEAGIGTPGALADADPVSLTASLDALVARHADAQLVVSLRSEGLLLSQIRVPPRLQREGKADAALKDLVGWADSHRKVMALTPERVGTGASRAALERWYRRHGFVANKGPARNLSFRAAMIRNPREVELPLIEREPGRSGGAGFEM
jgi:hypothetical protein